MHRRATDSLAATTAGIIAFTGQCLLTAPHLLGALVERLPETAAVPGGLLFFITGWFLYSTITFESVDWKTRIIFFVGAGFLAGLSYFYFRANLYISLPLLAALTFALIIAASAGTRGRLWGVFWPLLLAISNLATGGMILVSGRLPLPILDPHLVPYKFWMGWLFIAAGISGFLIRILSELPLRNVLDKLAVLPWTAWLVLQIVNRDFSEVIPAACIVINLILLEIIPWGNFKLPPQDILGKRLIIFIASAETLLLSGFTFLLGPKGETISSDTRGLLHLVLLCSEVLLCYVIVSVLVTINKLSQGITATSGIDPSMKSAGIGNRGWEQRIARLIEPYAAVRSDQEKQIHLVEQKLLATEKQLELEKKRGAQLVLLAELSQQLETQLDPPVSAQLAVNTLQRSIDCTFAALYVNDPERRELVVLAVSGNSTNILPPGYRQPISEGVLGRTIRQRKTQIVNDTLQDPDFIQGTGDEIRSLVAVPLIDHGHMKGALEIGHNELNAFGGHEVQIAEATARTLLRAWERSEYHRRLTDLIQAGVSMTTQPDPQTAVQEVANIARQTLRARFVFATLLDQDGNFTRIAYAGTAPRLLKSISQKAVRETLIQSALNAERPFRVRDIRRYRQASRLEIDFSGLRSLIAIPIRMHGLSIGAMLAFGKQGEVFFTENDESLARLLSSQASAAIESAWLSHELRTSLATTTQLYQLSFHVIQAEEIKEAAAYIAEAALRLCSAKYAGIILFAPDGAIEAEVELDENGNLIPIQHPMRLVRRAMESQQSIIFSTGKDEENICFPLKTRVRVYGAIWLTVHDHQSARFITNLQTLVNQAGVALERAILLAESRQHAKAIEHAYRELENAYDHTLAALMSALDARDRETEGHSVRVARIARLLGEGMFISPQQRKVIERGSLLHDIGKIGISDTILHKPGPLNEAEWEIMRQHPDIGARIVEGIPFLDDTLPIIRYHQERWDGSGYPLGLAGQDIPILARIFAVADAFDALTSDRPYRKRISNEEALVYMQANAGILFDPQVVSALIKINSDGILAD